MNTKKSGVAKWSELKQARSQGALNMLDMVIYTLESKFGFTQDDICKFMNDVSYVTDAISEGRLNMKDIRKTVKEEVGVSFKSNS